MLIFTSKIRIFKLQNKAQCDIKRKMPKNEIRSVEAEMFKNTIVKGIKKCTWENINKKNI